MNSGERFGGSSSIAPTPLLLNEVTGQEPTPSACAIVVMLIAAVPTSTQWTGQGSTCIESSSACSVSIIITISAGGSVIIPGDADLMSPILLRSRTTMKRCG